MRLLKVEDESTELVRYRFLNSQLCLWIGLVQVMVCLWGLAQHGHSFRSYNKILHCDFETGSLPLESADAIIFDVGLFYSLWGIRGCVAEYLDGGFGRLIWCISHCLSLLFSLPFAFVSRPRPYCLWPLLLQQSVYGVCLLILLLAALPRILPLVVEPATAPVAAIVIYISGTLGNFFLLYIYWHWYWHVDNMWNTAVRIRFGTIVRNANNRSRRDKPMIPKEEVTFPSSLAPLPEVYINSLPPSTSMTSSVPETVTSSLEVGTSSPPVIIATKVLPDSVENRHLRLQEIALAQRRRRKLPPTPPTTSPPTGRPVFFLNHSEV